MTKKILVLSIILVFSSVLFPQQRKLVTSHVYLKSYPELLIGDSDLYCSYEIVKRINRDLKVISSNEIFTSKTQYTSGDTVYINKGSLSGLKTGDRFLFFTVVKKVYSPGTLKYLGRLIQKKGVGILTEVKDKSASVKLEITCLAITIGDNLIPFKEEEKVVKKAVDFSKSYLPGNLPKGKVIYSFDYGDINRVSNNSGNIVASNLGIGEVSKGDFVLFYRIVRKDLPIVIIGSGIILKPQNSNSTIKIIDSSTPILVGELFSVLPPVKEETSGKMGEPPLIKKSEEITQNVKKTEETFDFAVLFNLNEAKVSDKYDENFSSLKEFIGSKSEVTIILRGYACSIGDFAYNLELSKKRVEAVKELLISKYGIAEDLIETFFYGEKDAPFDNSSEQSRRKNRRVDIQVIGK